MKRVKQRRTQPLYCHTRHSTALVLCQISFLPIICYRVQALVKATTVILLQPRLMAVSQIALPSVYTAQGRGLPFLMYYKWLSSTRIPRNFTCFACRSTFGLWRRASSKEQLPLSSIGSNRVFDGCWCDFLRHFPIFSIKWKTRSIEVGQLCVPMLKEWLCIVETMLRRHWTPMFVQWTMNWSKRSMNFVKGNSRHSFGRCVMCGTRSLFFSFISLVQNECINPNGFGLARFFLPDWSLPPNMDVVSSTIRAFEVWKIVTREIIDVPRPSPVDFIQWIRRGRSARSVSNELSSEEINITEWIAHESCIRSLRLRSTRSIGWLPRKTRSDSFRTIREVRHAPTRRSALQLTSGEHFWIASRSFQEDLCIVNLTHGNTLCCLSMETDSFRITDGVSCIRMGRRDQ